MPARSRPTGPAGGRRPVGRAAPARPTGRVDGNGSRRPARTRPGAAARPAGEPGAIRSSTAWVRGVVLLFMVVLLAVMLVPTLRSYLRQRGDIAAVNAQIAAQHQQIAALTAEQAKWQDPAYIEQQARQRLKFVDPGDRLYIVLDPVTDSSTAVASSPIVQSTQVSGQGPWYGRLWESMSVADDPTAGTGTSQGAHR